MLASIAFYLFSAILLASAIMVVTARNPVHSVLFLILAFFNAAGLFVLLGAEFVAMILVIVYVGAVAVLFLFVVMMLNVDATDLRHGFAKYLPVGALVGLILFLQLAFVLTVTGADPASLTVQLPIHEGVTNTQALGEVMYTRYAYIFQVCGLILLVAMMGAIVLTLRKRELGNGGAVLRQNVNAQIERKRASAVHIETVKSGEGVTL